MEHSQTIATDTVSRTSSFTRPTPSRKQHSLPEISFTAAHTDIPFMNTVYYLYTFPYSVHIMKTWRWAVCATGHTRSPAAKIMDFLISRSSPLTTDDDPRWPTCSPPLAATPGGFVVFETKEFKVRALEMEINFFRRDRASAGSVMFRFILINCDRWEISSLSPFLWIESYRVWCVSSAYRVVWKWYVLNFFLSIE